MAGKKKKRKNETKKTLGRIDFDVFKKITDWKKNERNIIFPFFAAVYLDFAYFIHFHNKIIFHTNK